MNAATRILGRLIDGPTVMALGGSFASVGGVALCDGHYVRAAVLIIVSCPLWGIGKARFRREVLASIDTAEPTPTANTSPTMIGDGFDAVFRK